MTTDLIDALSKYGRIDLCTALRLRQCCKHYRDVFDTHALNSIVATGPISVLMKMLEVKSQPSVDSVRELLSKRVFLLSKFKEIVATKLVDRNEGLQDAIVWMYKDVQLPLLWALECILETCGHEMALKYVTIRLKQLYMSPSAMAMIQAMYKDSSYMYMFMQLHKKARNVHNKETLRLLSMIIASLEMGSRWFRLQQSADGHVYRMLPSGRRTCITDDIDNIHFAA